MGKDTAYELCLRLNADEAKKLMKDAKRCGLSRSAYLRALIMKTQVKECQTKELRDLYAEINKIGSNINQIARSVNAGIATPETAAESVFLLRRIHDLLYGLVSK